MIKAVQCDSTMETVCDVCESILQYDPEDVFKTYQYGWFSLKSIKTYVLCPVCNSRVHLRTIPTDPNGFPLST